LAAVHGYNTYLSITSTLLGYTHCFFGGHLIKQQQQLKNILIYVQEKFFDVLIPAEYITKQDLLGKGDHFLSISIH